VQRHILIVSHTGRRDSIDAALEVCNLLAAVQLVPVLPPDEFDDIRAAEP
jgi:NAD+ kinase